MFNNFCVVGQLGHILLFIINNTAVNISNFGDFGIVSSKLLLHCSGPLFLHGFELIRAIKQFFFFCMRSRW